MNRKRQKKDYKRPSIRPTENFVKNDSFYIKTDDFEAAFNNKNYDSPVLTFRDDVVDSLSEPERTIYVCDNLHQVTMRDEFADANLIRIRHTISAIKNQAIFELIEKHGFENLNMVYVDFEHKRKMNAPKIGQDFISIEYAPGRQTNLPAYVISNRYPEVINYISVCYKKRDDELAEIPKS